MMRMLSLSALAATALCGATLAITSATAQTPAPACGVETYSVADQKYVGVPCTPKTEAGQTASPCGVESYSVAEQKYVGVPCTAPTPQAAAGQTAPCGVETYSVAEQKYVGVPCAHK
jgi:hypothetical protein